MAVCLILTFDSQIPVLAIVLALMIRSSGILSMFGPSMNTVPASFGREAVDVV